MYQPSPINSLKAKCLPPTRPENCIPPAWEKLQEIFNGEKCPTWSIPGECDSPMITWTKCSNENCDDCLSITFNDGQPGSDEMCLKKSKAGSCIWTGNMNSDGSYVAVTASSGQCKPFSPDTLEVSHSSEIRCLRSTKCSSKTLQNLL